jgi:hypothetical protein
MLIHLGGPAMSLSRTAICCSIVLVAAACASPTAPATAPPNGSGMPTESLAAAASASAAATSPTPEASVEIQPTEAPSVSAEPSPSAAPSPVVLAGFTTIAPTAPAATWKTLRWRKLAADDPLAAVRSVVRFKGGYLAIGKDVGSIVTARTPLWASRDGTTWQPVDPATLGTSTLIIGVAPTVTGLVALTVQAGETICIPSDTVDRGCFKLAGPMQSWTSTDGMSWVAHPGPDFPPAGEGPAPLFAGGSRGLVAVQEIDRTHRLVARSADGTTWTDVHVTFPRNFEIGDLLATPTGFLLVADIPSGADSSQAAIARSVSGRTWSVSRLPYQYSNFESADGALVATHGYIVMGGSGSVPSGPLWWQSADGRTWRGLKTFGPIGLAHGVGEASAIKAPDGDVAGDGARFVALRSSAVPVGWTSSDGRVWVRLALSGSRPDLQTGAIIALPMGVLVSTDTSSWFGDALTK